MTASLSPTLSRTISTTPNTPGKAISSRAASGASFSPSIIWAASAVNATATAQMACHKATSGAPNAASCVGSSSNLAWASGFKKGGPWVSSAPRLGLRLSRCEAAPP